MGPRSRAVAQLVARTLGVREVVSSNLAGPTIKIPTLGTAPLSERPLPWACHDTGILNPDGFGMIETGWRRQVGLTATSFKAKPGR